MPNPALGDGGLHHVAIKTRDWDRTMDFYQGLLGCAVKIAWGQAPKRAVMLDTGGGSYVEVFEDASHQPGPNPAWLHFALRTTKLDEVTERCRSWGAKITLEPKDVPIATTNIPGPVPVRISFCEGPNGELIEFFQNSAT
jgi:glyoxylase I family protein